MLAQTVLFIAFHIVDAIDVDGQLFLQHINLFIERELLPTEQPRLTECGATYHHRIHSISIEG